MVGAQEEEILFDNYGTCSGFADTMVLLLNNPYIGLECRKVHSDDHYWNIVLINGRLYQIDITRSMTYSPYRYDNNLKTRKFNKEYILYGQNFSDSVGHEKISKICYLPQELSADSFDPNYIEAAIEHLKDLGIVEFNYENNPPRYKRVKRKFENER